MRGFLTNVRLLQAKRAYALLVLALFVSRALVPAGWMPDFAASGGSPIVICTASGFATLYVDADGKPIHHKQSPGEPCLLGSLAPITTPVVAINAPRFSGHVDLPYFQDVRVPHLLRYTTGPARAAQSRLTVLSCCFHRVGCARLSARSIV
jgi:hypothetical protein